MSDGGKVRVTSSVDLGGGVVGHKSVVTHPDGHTHVTHSLNTDLRRSYDVGADGSVYGEHYVAQYGKGKHNSQVTYPTKSWMDNAY